MLVRLLTLAALLSGCLAAQSLYAPPVRFLSGTAAPASTDCDAAAERGAFYIRVDNPATNPSKVYACTQTGASSYGWQLISHKVGTTAPAKCDVGDIFFDSDATAGSNWFGCTAADTWTLMSGGASAAGFFGNSTAVTSSFSATPTFSLADVSSKSPTRFEPGAMTANVTSVTFTNKTAGAKFSVVWVQDGTGSRTVAYGASASNTCAVSPTASKTTIQKFEVAADGTTVVGVGCTTDDALDAPPASAPLVGTDSLNRIILASPFATNAQTATYQVLSADFTSYKTIIVASGTFTITLVASGSQPPTGQKITVINYGSGVVTIARSGQNINGGTTSLTVPAGSATAPTGAEVVSNGTDYFALLFGASSGGGISNTQGTYSALPGTCATSDQYVLTDSYYAPVRCSATNTWSFFLGGHLVTLPTAASTWTLVNGASGTATKADSRGAVTISSTSSVLGFEAILKAVPSAPYIRTMAVKIVGAGGGTTGNTMFCGAVYTDGTATTSDLQGIFFTLTDGPLARVSKATDFSWTGISNDTVNFGMIGAVGATVWFQLEDDNTTKYFRMSADGVNFPTLFSVGRTTNFTPADYGVGCGNFNAGSAQPFILTLLSDTSGTP